MVVQTPKKKMSPFMAKKRAAEKKAAKAKVDKVAAELEGSSPSKKSETKKEKSSASKTGKATDTGTKKESSSKAKQARMRDDGSIEDVDADEVDGGDDKPLKNSQAKVVAELAGIALRQGQRVFALKLNSSTMIRELTRIWNEQRSFMMAFKIPVEKKDGEVTKWKTVEFSTKLIDLSLKGKDSATCHGYIDHAGAIAMSELILDWKGGVEFLLDGVQQSMF